MSDDYEIGYGKPPKARQWKKGQSGNLKGRPKTRSDLIQDAAAILSEPVRARTPRGKAVSLDGIEAAYLALCRKGLRGNVPGPDRGDQDDARGAAGFGCPGSRREPEARTRTRGVREGGGEGEPRMMSGGEAVLIALLEERDVRVPDRKSGPVG